MKKSWNGLRLEVVEYCKKNHISEKDFRFPNIYEWENVYNSVLKHFVDKRYAMKHGLYWANIENGFQQHLKRIYAFSEGVENNFSYEWIAQLPNIVTCEKVYLLLEENKGKVNYWIAECNPAIIHFIINEALEPLDYYMTDKKFHWLITENHHDFVQFIGEGLHVETIKTVCTK